MDTKNKIMKLAKVCYVIAKVLYIIAFVVCLAFIALAIALPLTNAISSLTTAETAIVFATLALYAFVCIGLLWNVEGLFKSIAKGQSPFNQAVNHYLKKIAVFVLIMAIVPALLGTALLRIIEPATEIVFPVSVSGIISGIVLFVIGVCFQYGIELQKKDDETL